AAFLVIILIGSLISGQVIRSRAYRDLLEVTQGDFTQDVEAVDYTRIPMLDRDSAERLGDRVLGELSDMVSQFEVANDYSQINFQGRPVRVTPLEYGDLIKWLNNRGAGLPAYIMVDMVTQEAEVVRLEDGMKYTTTEHFSRNLYRHIRFRYPTYIFGEPTFEVDEEGTPYWVCPRIVKRIGLFGGEDIRGGVLVNAVTGESEYYATVPEWVDRLYSAELIIQQYDYHGLYVHGWINSVLGQRDVTITTSGYNYIAMNDDVYMYTGITSVGTDQSNIGFILSNQRTKESTFYSVAGATEESARASAEGVVQHLGYDATFPLLLNIGGEPTYFMSLKDNAGLVKMYAMVNVSQYQIVGTGASVAECEENYINLLKQNNIETDSSSLEIAESEKLGVIEDIRSSVIEGNTYYYIRLEGDGVYYSISASASPQAGIVNPGDTVRLELAYGEPEGGILEALSLEIVSQDAASVGEETSAEEPAAEAEEAQTEAA
ncbi:MAG: CvpA family protein, partial [Oscillospiraceae bacterium]|nr:CvpA family protein [Oscillospiraceae bacterium]